MCVSDGETFHGFERDDYEEGVTKREKKEKPVRPLFRRQEQ